MTYLPEIQLLRIGFPIPVTKGEIVFKFPSKRGFDFTISIEKLTNFDFSTKKLKSGKWEIEVNWSDESSNYFMESEIII